MWSPELPHLVTQDTPTPDIVPLAGGPRRRSGWLLAGTAALLLGGGISASLANGPGEPSRPVGTSTVAEEAPRPTEITTTALGGSQSELLQAMPTNAAMPTSAGPDDRPSHPPL